MARDTNTGSSRPHLQRQDLRPVHPRNNIDRSTKNEHIDEKEGNGGRRRVFLSEAQQDGSDHHAAAQSKAAIEHRLLAAHAIKSKSGTKVTNDEHELDKPSDDLCGLRSKFHRADENGGHVVDDHIDTWSVSKTTPAEN